MSIDSRKETHRSSIGHLSRSTIGRVTERNSRLVGGSATIQAAEQFFRKQLWAWPIVAAILFGGAGWWVHHSVESAMRERRVTDLNAMVDASVAALRSWMHEQRIIVQLFASDEKLRPMVNDLLRLSDDTPDVERNLHQAKAQQVLRKHLTRQLQLCGYVGYVIVSPESVVLAADQDASIGKSLTGYRDQIFDKGLVMESVVSKPYRSSQLLCDEKGELRSNLPTMFAVAPICDDAGKPIATLGLRIRPEDQFTRILQVVRFGESGETYAFDRNGLLLSQSRFDDNLKQIGLLADQPNSHSILTIEIRDPQVNMAVGERPAIRREDQPLTRLAANAIEGTNGHDANGYRDYRGVPAVGAWRWLEDYEIGIATEMDVAEAFQPFYILRRAFWVLMALLSATSVGIFLVMLHVARQQKELQRATLAAKQFGQYTLDEKLGAGAMGTVYKARHAMLRRPTAVKLMNIDTMSDDTVARFEREVQLTSTLTHQNTVAVFDYGRTPDGIFYYAMEYLDGMNLDDLVKRFGPLSESRLIYILKQVCGSLAEAHSMGLVHRDIKPANIFLTRRGGMSDFVKVLDFGLVKTLDGEDHANLTNPKAVTGTPLYLSPEAMMHADQVDARTDVYAIGAVGYYLLTGSPVFKGATVIEICMKHVNDVPESPSTRRGEPICQRLEALLLRCLSKSPASRPANAAELLHELDACEVIHQWTTIEADVWWNTQERLGGCEKINATTEDKNQSSPDSFDTDLTIAEIPSQSSDHESSDKATE